MTHIAYKLIPRPRSGFHLGREGLDQEVSVETFPSDSLFAALIAALVQIEGAEYVDTFASAWPQAGESVDPPFRVSSLFPFAGELLLFPMPRLRVNLQDVMQPGMSKQLKHLEYVSPAILNRLLIDQAMDSWLSVSKADAKGVLLQDGKVWIDSQEVALLPESWRNLSREALSLADLWQVGRTPRVTIDRQSNSSTIFHVGRTEFADDCGLWMLADVTQGGDLLDELLDYLADQGIGGERSSGHGAFTKTVVQAPSLPAVNSTSRVMTLSRYNPTLSELTAGVLGEGASYELVDVGGWLGSPGWPAQRRKRVRMIEAGSVLVAAVPITGQLVDVRPEYETATFGHPVYRSGIALPVGVTGGD